MYTYTKKNCPSGFSSTDDAYVPRSMQDFSPSPEYLASILRTTGTAADRRRQEATLRLERGRKSEDSSSSSTSEEVAYYSESAGPANVASTEKSHTLASDNGSTATQTTSSILGGPLERVNAHQAIGPQATAEPSAPESAPASASTEAPKAPNRVVAFMNKIFYFFWRQN